MKTRLYQLLKFAIGWPLSLIAFFFIAKILWDQAPTLQPNLTNLNLALLIFGSLSFIIFYFLRSFLWYRIIKGYGYKLSFKESGYMWSMSELKRYIPGNIWGFLGRAVLFSNKDVKKKDIATGLIIEAELFVIGCAVVSLLALPFLYPDYTPAVRTVFSVLVVIGLFIYFFNRQIVSYLPKKLHKPLHFLFPPFEPSENLLLVVVSTVALGFFGIGNYLILSAAVATDPQLVWQLTGVFVLAFVAGYLSIVTPAGFGVREGIVIFALSKIMSSGLAAFIALFTRIMLILSEVIFIGLNYLWYKSTHPVIAKIEKWFAKNPHLGIVAGMSAIYALYIGALSNLRYENYYTGRFDLGNMVQTVWNTVHGNFFMLTDPNGVVNISRLAFHADFILVLLAPIYALWQDPRNLLVIQAIVIAFGAIFVYLIAKEILKHNVLAMVFAFAYLINPSVQRANLYDFHAVVLATTFLLGMFYFYLKRRYKLFILFAILAALCKEQIWLIIALFGILVALHHRKWLLGLGVFAISAGMFFFLLWYAIPAALGDQHFALEYYSSFGSSPTDIVKSIILQPDKVLQTALEPERMRFIDRIFSPLGYLSYVFPFFLIFAGPDLLISMLSSNANLYQIYYQYTATMTPFIFLSAIFGAWVILWISRKWSVLRRLESARGIKSGATVASLLVVYILYYAFQTAAAFGPLPGSKEPNTDMYYKPLPNRAFIDNYLESIPQDASVSAANNIASHLSQRKDIYVIPNGIDRADLVILHEDDPNSEKTELLLKNKKEYKLIINNADFKVFERK